MLSMVTTRQWILLIYFFLTTGSCYAAVTLHASLNVGGIRGNITFYQESPSENVTISVHLQAGHYEQSKTFSWGVHKFAVLYDSKSPCSSNELGQTIHDFSRRHGPITIPSPNGTVQSFSDPNLQLTGRKGIWGRSLLLRSQAANDDTRTCGNILDGEDVKTAEALFTASPAGRVIFRQVAQLGTTTIFSNLFHTSATYTATSRHDWKILTMDILQDATSRDSKRRPCDYLSALFDPTGFQNDTHCGPEAQDLCRIGDMARKHGEIAVGPSRSRYSKGSFIDTNLPLSSLDGARPLYLVLYEKGSGGRIMACARIRPIKPREVKAHFDMDGAKGFVRFSQRYRMDPTVVTVNLRYLRGRGSNYHVHLFPVPPRVLAKDDLCSSVGGHFNPFGVLQISGNATVAQQTSDKYEVGDLSGKHGRLDSSPLSDFYFAIYADFNLPLFGRHSIVGRSVVIHRPDGSRWICASIGYPGQTRTAVANFFYPVVGQVFFRQDKDDPWSETTIFGQLSYGDGSLNDTENHRWDIHEFEPSRDFYNWTQRCVSAGGDFNSFDVGLGRQYERFCGQDNTLRCRVGDLTSKLGRISIAHRQVPAQSGSKFFFVDVLLPLAGPHTVVGRSLVLHDDHAPPHRGDRLACTSIRYVAPLTVRVRTWNSARFLPSNLTGSLSLSQDTSWDSTQGELALQNLGGEASLYHIHQTWVPLDREFPCTTDSVLGHFNPYGVNVSVGPAPGVGSSDQYEVGDLSGKLGTLDGKDDERTVFSDPNLPLHGTWSVVGRSVVVQKKERNWQWVCGTLELGYRKEEAREIVALASFDHPGSFLSGFVRMRQLEYLDGSISDTFLEVSLHYPDKNSGDDLTVGHSWAIFVNQVGHDAVERVASVRCIGAGYLWNPYILKSDDEHYKKECGPSNPFRCQMGDMTGKHGPVEIDGSRKVFADVNLPLVGNYSVLGRSVVVFDLKGNKLSCANIKLDAHLVRYVAVRKIPGFTSEKFMRHMRQLLNASEWLVVEEVQAQREILDGQCVQLLVHFYGGDAHRHQIEFSNLLNLGSLRKQTRFGLRKIETYYKPCQNIVDEFNASHRAAPIQHLLFLLVLGNLVRTFVQRPF